MTIPKKIDISAAWYGDELRNKSELWSYQLNSKEIIELENEKLSGKVVTKLSLLKNYCAAEEYHQKYFDKR